MRALVGLASVVLAVAGVSACAVSPPMVEVVVSSTPGPCEAAFAALADAGPDERDALVTATLQDCSLDAWHLQDRTLLPQLPVERVADPAEQLTELCADERRTRTAVCREAGEQP